MLIFYTIATLVYHLGSLYICHGYPTGAVLPRILGLAAFGAGALALSLAPYGSGRQITERWSF